MNVICSSWAWTIKRRSNGSPCIYGRSLTATAWWACTDNSFTPIDYKRSGRESRSMVELNFPILCLIAISQRLTTLTYFSFSESEIAELAEWLSDELPSKNQMSVWVSNNSLISCMLWSRLKGHQSRRIFEKILSSIQTRRVASWASLPVVETIET